MQRTTSRTTLARRVPGGSTATILFPGCASAHMAGQMCVSRFMLGSWAALLQAPLLLAASVAAGIATGVLCRAAMHALRGLDPRIERAVRKMESAKR